MLTKQKTDNVTMSVFNKIRRPPNRKNTVVILFDYDMDNNPITGNVFSNSAVITKIYANSMIDDFFEKCSTLNFWTDIIGCATNESYNDIIGWDYNDDGDIYPIYLKISNSSFTDAFRILVDLTMGEYDPHYTDEIRVLVTAHLYAIISSCDNEVIEKFFNYTKMDNDFSFINYDDLYQCYRYAMSMDNIIF